MAQRQHIIELNGQAYDARTGKVVAPASARAKTKSTEHKPLKTQPAKASSARNMDGVSRQRTVQARAVAPAAKVHAKPQHSKTLMRTTVKRPHIIKKSSVKPHTAPTPVPAVSHELKTPVKPERVIRSMGVQKSTLISKFGKAVQTIRTEPLPVKHAPDHAPAIISSASLSNTPSHKAKSDLFATALHSAQSHNQPKAGKQSLLHRSARKLHISPHTLALGCSAVIVLAIGSFVAYQNVPKFAMKVAAARAGFHASLPSYEPAGFNLRGPISSDPGQVSVQYKSTTDERDYKVVQRASEWNSDALLENIIGGKQHQIYQANGRTIYIYDDSNATWVDGGVWYKIEGNSALTSDQLLKIANSL